jgi:polyphenol oxidase
VGEMNRGNQIAGPQPAGSPSRIAALNLEAPFIRHGFYLRTGGVSEGIYSSLNCGRGSRDELDRVEENRARVASQLETHSRSLIGPRQTHSAKSVVVDAPWCTKDAPEADAVVTKTSGIAIGVLTADCAPILMADPQSGVIAAVHAGWKGAKAGVIESAVTSMESLGAQAARIVAAIGPCISAAAYEVGPEFKTAFLADGQENEKYFSIAANGRLHFNLPAYVKDLLSRCGVFNIQDLALCTYRNESILFSHRRSVHRDETDYGRQISAILLG